MGLNIVNVYRVSLDGGGGLRVETDKAEIWIGLPQKMLCYGVNIVTAVQVLSGEIGLTDEKIDQLGDGTKVDVRVSDCLNDPLIVAIVKAEGDLFSYGDDWPAGPVDITKYVEAIQ